MVITLLPNRTSGSYVHEVNKMRAAVLAAVAATVGAVAVGGCRVRRGGDRRRPPPHVMRRRPVPDRPAGARTSGRTSRCSTRRCRRRDIQATVDAVAAQQLTNQFGTQRYALLFEPGTYGTARRSAQLPGRLLHRGRGSRSQPRRRHDQRLGRRPQPVRPVRLVHRAEQLLALAVEPHDQRDQPERRLLQQHRVLGGVAGRTDAPRARHQRHHHADGLLHRARPSPAVGSSPTRSSTDR